MNRIRDLCRDIQAEYKRHTSHRTTTTASDSNDCNDLPQEIEEGNVEYKLQLIDATPDRVKHLTTQLHWRLNEGKGIAFYEVGVRDSGEAVGIPLPSMIKSIRTLARMCQVLHAELEFVCFRRGREPNLRTARVRITRILDKKVKKQLRVSVIGDFESGKSTLIGVLTRGCLDDGCGLARMQVFRHRHEIENGCTSSISEHMIGITEDGTFCTSIDVVDGGDCELRDVVKGDISSILTLSDLAGHKKYLKITASGLASQFPDYVLLVVDSGKGVEAMTIEHIKMAIALEVAVFVVLTKIDVTPASRIAETVTDVSTLLRSICPDKPIRCCVDRTAAVHAATNDCVIPLLLLSSVTGHGVATLQEFLANLSPRRMWETQSTTAPEFQINKAYALDETGTIVTGLVQSGTIVVGEHLLLGPEVDGTFCEVTVDSIEVQRKAVPCLTAGETGALLIRVKDAVEERCTLASRIRKGMMLLHPRVRPMATLQFDAEVHLLRDVPAFKENYQAVAHAGQITQMVKVVSVKPPLVGSSRAICRFEFMYWPEYMRPDLPVVFRAGCAHAVGKVVRAVHHLSNELNTTTAVRTF